MSLFFYGILLQFAGGILTECMPARAQSAVFSVFAFAGSVLSFICAASALFSGRTLQTAFLFQFPVGEARFSMDPLAAFFVLTISLVYPLVGLYSAGYMKPDGAKKNGRLYHLELSILAVSMLLLMVTRNALLFLILWEVMSLSSFLLTAFDHKKSEVLDAALHYLIAMHIGVLFLIIAFAYLMVKSGGMDMAGFPAVLNSDPKILITLFLLIFAGFGTKAGFFPFHTWLPKAHPAAPSPVSALMSGLMLKTGIFGILLFISFIQTPPPVLGFAFLGISLFTAVFGIIYAMNAGDIKKQLAYSSIENIGIIGTGIATGLLGQSFGNPAMCVWGYGGALLHVFNHSLFKSSLFMTAGTVYKNLHTRSMEKMGGLAKHMPWTAAITIGASVAICGLPPLNGFISEFCLYFSMLSGIRTSPALFFVLIGGLALLALIGTIAVIAFTKSASAVFLGQPRNPLPDTIREPLSMVLPPLLLVALILAVGAFPQFFFRAVAPAVSILVHADIAAPLAAALWVLTPLSTGILTLYGLIAFFALLRLALRRKAENTRFKTWDCGYQAGTPRMQYSASSYSVDAEAVTTPILSATTELVKPEGFFPGPSAVNRHSRDLLDVFVHHPLKTGIDKLFALVSVIQSKTVQQYVIYVILVIVLGFVWIMVIH